MITVKIADIPIGIDNRYEHIESISRDYITDETPAFTVSVTDVDIECEREMAEDDYSPAYLESIAVFRKIAERLPEYDAIVFHSAVLLKDGKAYAFTAKSGTGKTTHTRLWISEFGDDVRYINGDKPIVRIIDGVPYAFGTPWRGKEGYGSNESAPLAAIALLERAERNSAQIIDSDGGVIRLMTQIHIPKDPVRAMSAMRVADRITSSVRFVELKCNMDKEAAHIAAQTILT